MNRSRNLFFAASVGPMEPSGVFLTMVQLTLMASHISIIYGGMGPSKVIYQRANIIQGEGALGGTCHGDIWSVTIVEWRRGR